LAGDRVAHSAGNGRGVSTQSDWLEPIERQYIDETFKSGSACFSDLVKMANLRPASDFRFSDLTGVDFRGSDIRGFDFTGADLSRTNWSDTKVDETTITTGAILSDAKGLVETDIPARLDRLPWGRFHLLVVVALGITWVFNGLEATVVTAFTPVLTSVMEFGNTSVGIITSAYVAGLVIGAVLFGWLSDRFGRRLLFFSTAAVYFISTAATAFAADIPSFALFRFLTGAGIGGEYSVINSTIQEFIPARIRGRIDLAVNATFWIGAALGALGSTALLQSTINPRLALRIAFLVGAVLVGLIVFIRLWIPESPRWLITHQRKSDAEEIVRNIEASFAPLPAVPLKRVYLRDQSHVSLSENFVRLFGRGRYRTRAVVSLTLMASQALVYNSIFLTYALVLKEFYNIHPESVGWYLLPITAGNFFGPILLGHFFDKVGRKIMISGTYVIAGLLLAGTGFMFFDGRTSAETQTLFWMCSFFFASSGASAAYLTAGETFPQEVRALAIALCVASGHGFATFGPMVLGVLIDTSSRGKVFVGYLVLCVTMVVAGLVQWIWGVSAERKSLEEVSRPLGVVGEV
jgi:MFS family permease